MAQLYRAAQNDGVLAIRFMEVANLIRQPAALLDPRVRCACAKGIGRTAAYLKS